MVAVILAVIVGLLGYLYYLHTQKKAPLPDLSSLAPPYDSELFNSPYTEKDAYLTAKRAEQAKAGRSEDEVSVSDVDAEGKKTLNGLLVRRAIAAVERAGKINEEIKTVQALQRGPPSTPPPPAPPPHRSRTTSETAHSDQYSCTYLIIGIVPFVLCCLQVV